MWVWAAAPDSGAMALCESFFGPYPFPEEPCNFAETAGCLQVSGQEVVGQPGCGLDSGADPKEARRDLLRGLAKEWWGASVTPEPAECWLSEGTARYAEALAARARGGERALRQRMEDFERPAFPGTVQGYGQGPRTAEDDSVRLAVASLKGAWVLNTLDWVLRLESPMEAQALPSILQSFPQRSPYALGHASTADFARFCEESSGLDLRWFFGPWVYGTGRPVLAFDWSAAPDEPSGAVVHLYLEQIQDDPLYPGGEPYPESPDFFPMFWEIRLHAPGGDSTSVVIHQTSRRQEFLLQAPHAVTSLSIDPDHHVLRELSPLPAARGVALLRIAPNPSPGQSVITYRLRGEAPATLKVYDLLGREIRTLFSGQGYQGIHLADWDGNAAAGRSAPEGLYFLRLVQGSEADTGKLILIRR